MYLTGKICNIAQKLRCESVAKSVLRFCHCPSNRKIFATAEEAERFLSGLCADPDNSCVCENVVSLTPKYDLQIVVPVYNTARYIEECVDSVLNQSTHYSYKIILVNDGSTDGSAEILRNYEGRAHVEIIEQQNAGLGAARNSAIKTIDANYLMFVDSDDRLHQGAIEKMLSVAYKADADVVDGDLLVFGKGIRDTIMNTITGKKDASGFRGYAHGKIIKSELFSTICFPNGYWFEDTLLPLVLLRMSKKFYGTSDVVYEYRQRSS